MKYEVFCVLIYSSPIPLRVWECSLPLQFLSAGFKDLLQQKHIQDEVEKFRRKEF